MSVLELGCGNGLFLRFLQHMGVENFLGVDGDPRVLEEMPESLKTRVKISDFSAFFSSDCQEKYDRIVLFDVLEHFSPEDGVGLLASLKGRLKEGGRVVVRVPNVASPFGLNLQYNDVTHRTAYTPGSIAQVARAAGCEIVAIRPQSYSSWGKEVREKLLTATLNWFLAMPPTVWSPLMIAVLEAKPKS